MPRPTLLSDLSKVLWFNHLGYTFEPNQSQPTRTLKTPAHHVVGDVPDMCRSLIGTSALQGRCGSLVGSTLVGQSHRPRPPQPNPPKKSFSPTKQWPLKFFKMKNNNFINFSITTIFFFSSQFDRLIEYECYIIIFIKIHHSF